eukprot:UN25942
MYIFNSSLICSNSSDVRSIRRGIKNNPAIFNLRKLGAIFPSPIAKGIFKGCLNFAVNLAHRYPAVYSIPQNKPICNKLAAQQTKILLSLSLTPLIVLEDFFLCSY